MSARLRRTLRIISDADIDDETCDIAELLLQDMILEQTPKRAAKLIVVNLPFVPETSLPSPAVRAKQQCRMHGGKSTKPRTKAASDVGARIANTVNGLRQRSWSAAPSLRQSISCAGFVALPPFGCLARSSGLDAPS
jgi:hypothetical protein